MLWKKAVPVTTVDNIREIYDDLEARGVTDILTQYKGWQDGGICAGVDVLEHAGLLDGIDSTHSTVLDVVVCDNIITARANGYVDFAIETAKKLNLFEDEADLQETIAFWREFQRVE